MKSSFQYYGGKFFVLKDIIDIYNKSGMTTVVDVFGGSGKFLLNVNAKNKVYNDINGRLVNVFKVLRDKHDELMQKFEWVVYSRRLFNEYLQPSDDEVEDAFRFLYVQLCSFGGNGKRFGYEIKSNRQAVKLIKLKERIPELYNEVKYWTIENLDFREVIERYDSMDTFFYLDPPYPSKKEYMYKHDFNDNDYIDLAKMLKNIQGKYVMNINENEFTLKVFGNPTFKRQYSNLYTINKKYLNGMVVRDRCESKRVELFYTNVDLNGNNNNSKIKTLDELLNGISINK